jgi:two-component system, chemotaxis family, chemotaxis protein CheY
MLDSRNAIANRPSIMLKPRAILCVDDQRLVHKLEEKLLEPYVRSGARILHAYDGAEALRMLASAGDVDLILLDINMPLLNGLAFLEQRQRTEYRSIPAIIFSNEGDRPDEIAHALSLGAVGVLPKPFTFEQLDACLSRLATD